MYMPLICTEAGVPHFVKQVGVSLEPGALLGILTLDDPSRVKHAKPFEGQLPSMGHPSVVGNKPHQQLATQIEILNNILDGYDNSAIMNSTLKELMVVLQNHDLPFSEVSAVLSALSGRMPSKLEDAVRAVLDAGKHKAGHKEFPAPRIIKIIETFLQDNLTPVERPLVRSKIVPLLDVLERYKHGLKGHEHATIAILLHRYVATEKLFGGSIEERVLKLREEHKDNLDEVAALVLSHTKAQNKNKLVMALLDMIKDAGTWSSTGDDGLSSVMKELASLDSK